MEDTATFADEHEALIQFLYSAPVGLVEISIDGEISMINSLSAQLLMPLSRTGGISNLYSTLEGVAPELRQLVAGFGRSRGKICDGLRIRVTADVRDKPGPQMLSLTLVKLDEKRLMAVLNDITPQCNLERSLKKNEAWLAAILTGITDYALVSLDEQGCIDGWNASIGHLTGFSRAAAIGRPYSIFYPDGTITPDQLRNRLQRAHDDGGSLYQGWCVKADGSRFWGSAMIVPLREQARPVVAGAPLPWSKADPAYGLIVRDITDQREAREAQRRSTSCDPLTGIANRQAFFDGAELELQRRIRSPRELSLILFDIDTLGRVNDTYGHPAGDAVLRQLSELLTANFREVDIVARLGGDEFAVLLPATDLDCAVGVANRLRQAACAQPVQGTAVDDITYTVSGGVVAMDEGVLGVDALMKRAELALSAAKGAGRNRVVCWSSGLSERT